MKLTKTKPPQTEFTPFTPETKFHTLRNCFQVNIGDRKSDGLVQRYRTLVEQEHLGNSGTTKAQLTRSKT
jgi:hypothetical protein